MAVADGRDCQTNRQLSHAANPDNSHGPAIPSRSSRGGTILPVMNSPTKFLFDCINCHTKYERLPEPDASASHVCAVCRQPMKGHKAIRNPLLPKRRRISYVLR